MVWILCLLACCVGFGASITHHAAVSLQSLAGGACFSALIILVGTIVQLMLRYLSVPPSNSSRQQALRIVDEAFAEARQPHHAFHGRNWVGAYQDLRARIEEEC